jgi:UDP-GlcNAc:undecaprenyl-phosphate GlcNAc-1-phosphate transferase
MTLPILLLTLVSFGLSWLTTRLVRRVAPRVGFVDKPGGRKIHDNPKPLGGGIGILAGIGLPMITGLVLLRTPMVHQIDRRVDPAYVSGAIEQTPLAVGLLATMGVMHALGLADDRRAMGPYTKLLIQLSAIGAFVVVFDCRGLTVLDRYGLGRWPSVAVTVLWIGMVTNAFNFLDNMDGLSAGVAAVCTTAFLIAALSIQQWFVAATLALLLGSLLGFLWFNFPPATIFMGDSGSLLIGLVLGVMTVRTTYLPRGTPWSDGWWAVFAPVVVLAVPLYDLIVVSTIRLLRGKSPFVGDTNHFSHRLVARGMSRRTAVLCLYLISAATSVAAILLPHVTASFAPLIFVQTILILGVVGLLEQHPLPAVMVTSGQPKLSEDARGVASTPGLIPDPVEPTGFIDPPSPAIASLRRDENRADTRDAGDGSRN